MKWLRIEFLRKIDNPLFGHLVRARSEAVAHLQVFQKALSHWVISSVATALWAVRSSHRWSYANAPHRGAATAAEKVKSARGENRTPDQGLMSPLLYR